MIFETYKQICLYIQNNPEANLGEVAEHLHKGERTVDVLLGTLKYMLNSPAFFKSEDGITWERVDTPCGIRRGPVDMLDGIEVGDELQNG